MNVQNEPLHDMAGVVKRGLPLDPSWMEVDTNLDPSWMEVDTLWLSTRTKLIFQGNTFNAVEGARNEFESEKIH